MLNKKNFTFFDVCSGIGAGHQALIEIGGECIGFSEINSSSEKTYRYIHNAHNLTNFGDIMSVDIDEIPEFDVLIGGFPCQSFSIIGKRQGFKDERGQIIYGIINVITSKTPKYFILENVKGLISHEKGRTFQTIKEMIDKSGYSLYSNVLKSSDYGIPQIRERIYLVGVRKDIEYTYSFPSKIKSEKNQLKDFLIDDNQKLFFDEQSVGWDTFIKYLNNKYNFGKYNLESLRKKEFHIFDIRQSDLRIYDENSPTLRTGRHGILYVKNNRLRKLSGFEAFLLQGFPENKAKKALITANNNVLLSQAGNAFTVDVIREIAKNLPIFKI